jgi:acyl-coenzyme A thioesterase 9
LERQRASETAQLLLVRAKSPKDSLLNIKLPFATDELFKEEYLRFDGGVRFEFILEDLDAAAGNIAFHHVDAGFINSPQLSLVTAAVDGITMQKRFPVDRDLEMKGCVSWVGSSSMEITIEISEQDRPDQKILESFFVMAARDGMTGKSTKINPLNYEGDSDSRWKFMRGEMNKKRRIDEASASLKLVEPSQKESSLIHKIMMGLNKLKEESIPMKQTELEMVTITQPQDRNTRNKIFGGYLMRRAFELARSTAYLYSGPSSQPFFLAIDDIAFLKPVKIGSLIRFKSKVVYSPENAHSQERGAFQVLVSSEITDLANGAIDTSNVFHLTFGVNRPENITNWKLEKIIPETYQEAMEYLDGKRRYEHSKNNAFTSKSALFEYY